MNNSLPTSGLVRAVGSELGNLRLLRSEGLSCGDGASTRSFAGCCELAIGTLDQWDDALMEELAKRAVRPARESGTVGHLPIALVYRAGVHIHAGEFRRRRCPDRGVRCHHRRNRLLDIGLRNGLDPVVARQPGDGPQLRRVGVGERTLAGLGRAVGGQGHMLAILYKGLGRYDDALASAQRSIDHDDLGICGLAFVELIEAASRSSALDAATDALAELEHERWR